MNSLFITLLLVYSVHCTCFYSLTKSDDKYWLVTPEGTRTLALGVKVFRYEGDYCPATNSSPYNAAVSAKYGNETTWADAAVSRAQQWGFNMGMCSA